MKIKCKKILNSKFCIFLDKCLRKIGYYFELECNTETGLLTKISIRKTYE